MRHSREQIGSTCPQKHCGSEQHLWLETTAPGDAVRSFGCDLCDARAEEAWPKPAHIMPLRVVIEAALRSAAKCEEAYGRKPTWMSLASHVAEDPELAEAYSLLATHRAKQWGLTL